MTHAGDTTMIGYRLMLEGNDCLDARRRAHIMSAIGVIGERHECKTQMLGALPDRQ